ncbi:MAG: hypothetical protein ABIQ52_00795 [Vicinamibacterales bacterium]
MRHGWAGSVLALGACDTSRVVIMLIFWLIPLTILALGATTLVRARRRGKTGISLPQEPVSGQWLAEARSRDEHPW